MSEWFQHIIFINLFGSERLIEKIVQNSSRQVPDPKGFLSIENRTNKIGTGHFVWIRKDSGLEGFGLARLHCIESLWYKIILNLIHSNP
jgi:hypothetical protein